MAQSPELTSREQEVVDQLLAGKSNKLIAAALHISVRTVEFHLKNIYEKHQVSSRTELILKLGQSTVVDQGELVENEDAPDAQRRATSWREALSRSGKEFRMKITVDEDTRAGGTPVAFHEAILIAFTKYADFDGRASRSEFWWFALFVTLVTSALTYLSEALASMFLIAVLLPLLAVGARRLHDTGRSGWWQLFLLAPVGGLVILGVLWSLPAVVAPLEEKLPLDEQLPA